MRVAVEGCAHGELEKIYETIENIEKQENYKIDLLICCGDFQASRNLDDLETMAVPKKYRDICTFYKYYSGEKIAPILTIFIGGNHEASNHLQELPYGGWAAPNIYYLGYAGVVRVNGLRIAGISGIYKGHDFLKGHYEFAPYTESSKKSVYHTRQLEVFRLKQLSGNVDICLSHDWPRGIYNHGNSRQLIRFKPHFKDEIISNKLGSPACEELLNTLQPSYWFSAHMHCKFAALVPHKDSEKVTKFLALDKCLPKRRFLQILDIESDNPEDGKLKFEYDIEWLTILYLTNHLINVKNTINYMPGPNCNERYNFTPTEEEKDLIRKKFGNNFSIPENFVKTVEPYNPDDSSSNFVISRNLTSKINPQTTQFCDILCIDDPLSLAMTISGHDLNLSNITQEGSEGEFSSFFQDSAQLSFSSTFSENISPLKRKSNQSLILPEPKNAESTNPDEIDIGTSDSENDDVIDKHKITTATEDNSEIISTEIDSIESSTIETSLEKSEITTDLKEISTNAINDIHHEEGENKEVSNPPIKKFKRRNQSIYTASEDNE